MDDKQQFGANKKRVDNSSSVVEESKACAPIREDASDNAAECKDIVSVEDVMEEEIETLDNDRVGSAVEGVEEPGVPAGVHQQQVELSEDAVIEQQEASTDCEQEGTGSANLDNMKALKYVVLTTLYQLWEVCL